MDASTAAATLHDVAKSYGATRALDGLSLSVTRGEMFGLIGPDGAGKTTTIRLLAGLLRPSRGQVRVFERDPWKDHRAITDRVGYLSQRFSLYGDLSVDENVTFFAEIHGVRHYQDRRSRLLELTQLTPFRHRLAEQLSGGMKQKLALACTLVHEPDLILLDEPTTGVDPVSRREFWKLLAEFLYQGLTVVMATPYLDEAERCTRVAFLHEGRLLALDAPDRLRDAYPGEIFEVIAEPSDVAADRLRAIDAVQDAQSFGERMHVRVAGRQGEAARAWLEERLRSAGLHRVQVRRIAPSLEDVFIQRLQGTGNREQGQKRE